MQPVVAVKSHGLIIGHRLSGQTLKNLGREFECSADTISRIVKKHPEHMEMFKQLNKETDLYELSKGIDKININGDFVVGNIIITGDPADGVIECQDIYVINLDGEGPYAEEDTLSYSIDQGDFVFNHTVKVGEVLIKERSNRYHTQKEVDYTYQRTLKLEPNQYNLPTIYYQDKAEKFLVDVDGPYEAEEFLANVDDTIEDNLPEKEYIWNASSKFISISVDTETYNADQYHPNFKEALTALINDEFEKAIDLINIERAVQKYISNTGNVRIENGTLYYKDTPLRSGLVDRILDSMEKGEDFERYIPFLENLMKNPSARAVQRLFDFLVANDIEITSAGYFIAWKYVNQNYMDCHTGTYNNSPGQLIEMPRNLVNDDDTQTCSHGLHVCSAGYLPTSGNYKIVSCLVHPKDVVSIPTDYKDSKMRTCRYEVLADVTSKFIKPTE